MTAELGLFFLILALMTALFQAACLLPHLRPLIAPSLTSAGWLQALCITLALAALVTLRLDSDFTVVNVVAHSNLTLPTLYKIAGTWGNHEGSMLLWVWVLAIFGAALAMRCSMPVVQPVAVAVQSLICAGFLLFILFTSNPFERRFPPTTDGEALNPLLQDIALSIHPPLLYLGYVGFSIVFSLAVAALLQGRMGREWAIAAHPWILAAWSALTLGIGLGSWWAYRTLGWGGFWFWDPVENASLLPWLSGTALLHANVVLKKRGLLAQWVLLLAILTFAMSLLGTFLVRSGVLASVHSFASDPMRGMVILAYITLLIGGALLLFALRAGRLQSAEGMLPLSREGMIVINNLFLLTACATVLLGTIYPLLAEWASGEKLTVGPPYFNRTFLPLMFTPLLFAALTPFMPWKQASLKRALLAARPALLATAGALLLVATLVEQETVLCALGFGLAVWLAGASLQWLVERRKSRGALAVFLGHMGAAVFVAGITGAGLWKQEQERWMRPGERLEIAGYQLRFDKLATGEQPDYRTLSGRFTLHEGSREIAALAPEYRLYHIRKSSASIAAVTTSPWRDVYVVIGEASKEGRVAVRAYYNPMIGWIWAGFMLMALGGMTGIVRGRHEL